MTIMTMNAMNHSLTGARSASKSARLPSLAVTKFLQARAALPEMPEQESHFAAVTGTFSPPTAAPGWSPWRTSSGTG